MINSMVFDNNGKTTKDLESLSIFSKSGANSSSLFGGKHLLPRRFFEQEDNKAEETMATSVFSIEAPETKNFVEVLEFSLFGSKKSYFTKADIILILGHAMVKKTDHSLTTAFFLTSKNHLPIYCWLDLGTMLYKPGEARILTRSQLSDMDPTSFTWISSYDETKSIMEFKELT